MRQHTVFTTFPPLFTMVMVSIVKPLDILLLYLRDSICCDMLKPSLVSISVVEICGVAV